MSIKQESVMQKAPGINIAGSLDLRPQPNGTPDAKPVRVLYSFPHKLGAGRICYTAWEQVNGLAAAGAKVTVMPGVLQRSVPAGVEVHSTLTLGKLRLPYKLFGTRRTCVIHDLPTKSTSSTPGRWVQNTR